MFINEDRIREIVIETLGIATKVINMTNVIEDKIFEIYKMSDGHSDIEVVFYVDELKVEFKHYYVNNIEELNYFDFKNGYSYGDNTLYLTYGSVVGDTINLKYLVDTIQHEVEHYWQCKNAGKSLYNNKQEALIDGKTSKNNYIRMFCVLFYLSNKFEIDAYVNGAFNVLRKLNCRTYKEFVEQTELKNFFGELKNIEDLIENGNFNSPEFLICRDYFSRYGFSNKQLTKGNLLKVLNNIREYAYKKIGKAWIYYVKEGTKEYTNEELEKMNPLERKLYHAAKHNEKMRLEGRKDDLVY